MKTEATLFVEQMITVQQLANLLKVSRRTIWRWLSQGRLPGPVRYSRTCVRWKASAIRSYMDALPAGEEQHGMGPARGVLERPASRTAG
jgi:excisionase family DNA binding protein